MKAWTLPRLGTKDGTSGASDPLTALDGASGRRVGRVTLRLDSHSPSRVDASDTRIWVDFNGDLSTITDGQTITAQVVGDGEAHGAGGRRRRSVGAAQPGRFAS